MIVFLLLLLVVAIVAAPFFRRRRGSPESVGRGERAYELVAAKEAKLAEISEAEMDFKAGKLSEEDYRELDRFLRRQAIGIIRDLDSLKGMGNNG